MKSMFVTMALIVIATNLRAQEPSVAVADIQAGAVVYRQWCADCHGPGRLPGTSALQRKYQGAIPAALEQRRDMPDALIRSVVRSGMSFMPSFRKTEITDRELALLSAYLTSDMALRARANITQAK
jgi:mono/diheme cytochrome c family protein